MLILWKFPNRIAGLRRTNTFGGHMRPACLRPLVYMVVKLHAQWNKRLLKFSYREHCWWLTSQTCVNTLINETSVKFEATTLYQFEMLLFIKKSHTKYVDDSQFAHHCFEPTCFTAVSSHCLAALPAKMSAFNSYMRQNAYQRNLKCIFEDLLPCYCYATKAIVEQFTCKFRNLPLQARSGHEWTASS